MTIEIRELVIKVKVEEPINGSDRADISDIKKELIKECKKEIVKQLKKNRER